MYGSWDMEHDGQNFLSFWVIFLPFYLTSNLQNKNFEKIKKKKKTLGDIILHMCTINDNHMMYGSWDMERDRQIFLSFWTIFLPFYSSKYPENQNFEKILKMPENITLYMCTIWCMVSEIWSMKFLSFWTIFCPFNPPNNPENKKNEKNPSGDIIILHMCTINYNHMMYIQFLRYANIPTVPTLVCCLAVLDWINLSRFSDFSPKIFYIHFIFHQQCNNLHK